MLLNEEQGLDGLVLSGLSNPLEMEGNVAEALFGDNGRTGPGTGDGLLLGLVHEGVLSDGTEAAFLAVLTRRAGLSLSLEESGRATSLVGFLGLLLTASVKDLPLVGENPRTEIDKEEDLLTLSVRSTLFVDKLFEDAFPPIIAGHLS